VVLAFIRSYSARADSLPSGNFAFRRGIRDCNP
jgi:hypothetical protein